MTPIPSIGRYPIDRLVATSVYGRIFLARDTALRRLAAIKLFSLTPEGATETCYDIPEWRRRFVLEAQVMSRLDHPHIIRILDFGHVEAEPFMVMPWMPANLRFEIGRDEADPTNPPRAISPERTIVVLHQLALALTAIHAAGLVHRDIKPTNLLLTALQGGAIKLCDFGYVKAPAVKDDPTVWFGSPDYMSPEQSRGADNATDRSDVYSAGVTGWRLLLGRLPPKGEAFTPPSRLPAALVELLSACTDADPRRRPSAEQMALRLVKMRNSGQRAIG